METTEHIKPQVKHPAFHIGRADTCLERITKTVKVLDIDSMLKEELIDDLEHLSSIHNDIMRGL